MAKSFPALRLTLITLLCVTNQSFTKTLITNATILTLAEGQDTAFVGDILIDDEGLISDISEGPISTALIGYDTKKVDASGKIVMPGFLSGHSHLWQSAFRGIATDGELWPWLEALHFTYGQHFNIGDFYAFTLHGAIDQLMHGVTTTYNHSHWLGDNYAQYLEQYYAGVDSGQNFIFAFTLDLNRDTEVSKDRLVELIDVSKGQENVLGFSINARGYQRKPEKFPEEISLAKELGLTTQIHYLEQSSRQVEERKQFPFFVESGALYPGMSFAHFIHTEETMLQTTAHAQASMIWNPLSNGRLGSGLADIPRYLEKGISVGMGVDGQASADISDPFENMRIGLYATRIRQEHSQGLQAIDLLRLHTLKTAEVLKVSDKTGSLETGKYADLLIIDPQDPITGPIFDPYATLVFACSSDNIEQVYVQGKLLVRDGNPILHDLTSIIQNVDTRVGRIRAALK